MLQGRFYGTALRYETFLKAQPMTCNQLSRAIGLERDSVSSVLTRLHRAGRVYIKAWVRDDDEGNGRRYTRAVYAVGAHPDAPRPTPESRKDIRARHQKKLQALHNARGRARRGNFNPYAQLMQGATSCLHESSSPSRRSP